MRRRDFFAGFAGAASWPLAARAQQRAVPVIGYLNGAYAENESLLFLPHSAKASAEQGYVEGRNVEILYRCAETQYDHLPALAADLVRRQVSVIVASGGPARWLAKAATTTIPIVFALGATRSSLASLRASTVQAATSQA